VGGLLCFAGRCVVDWHEIFIHGDLMCGRGEGGCVTSPPGDDERRCCTPEDWHLVWRESRSPGVPTHTFCNQQNSSANEYELPAFFFLAGYVEYVYLGICAHELDVLLNKTLFVLMCLGCDAVQSGMWLLSQGGISWPHFQNCLYPEDESVILNRNLGNHLKATRLHVPVVVWHHYQSLRWLKLDLMAKYEWVFCWYNLQYFFNIRVLEFVCLRSDKTTTVFS
jgi:hypothetical protein